MRASLFLATLVATLGLAAQALAQEPIPQGEVIADYTLAGEGSCCASSCGPRLHRRCRLKHHCGPQCKYEGLDRSFNCGCTGSYKFPVPPQYTYFWPGNVYSMGLMTNYHSPWRFPPLKPYTDEVLTPIVPENISAEEGLRPVSAHQPIAQPQLRPGEIEPMSSAMQRFFR